MAALGTYAENLIVNALLRNTTFTPPASIFLALYTSNPTAADTGTEITIGLGTNYARQPITFGSPTGGACASLTDIQFPSANSMWGNISFAAIKDAATGGHLLFYGPLVLTRFINTGDVIKFLAGNVTVSVT